MFSRCLHGVLTVLSGVFEQEHVFFFVVWNIFKATRGFKTCVILFRGFRLHDGLFSGFTGVSVFARIILVLLLNYNRVVIHIRWCV